MALIWLGRQRDDDDDDGEMDERVSMAEWDARSLRLYLKVENDSKVELICIKPLEEVQYEQP